MNDIGLMVDRLYDLRDKYRAKNKEVIEIKDEMTRIEKYITTIMGRIGIKTVGGENGVVELEEIDVPKVVDKSALRDHIVAVGDWDLLTQALKSTAFKERWKNGEEVPGVEKLQVEKFKLTKRN